MVRRNIPLPNLPNVPERIREIEADAEKAGRSLSPAAVRRQALDEHDTALFVREEVHGYNQTGEPMDRRAEAWLRSR